MVGITKKSCYGTFHVKVDVDMHYAIIFATINVILLIVIYKPIERSTYEKVFDTSHFVGSRCFCLWQYLGPRKYG